MKILTAVASFPPEVNSAAHLYRELTEDMRTQGHEVLVMTENPPGFRPAGHVRQSLAGAATLVRHDGTDVLRVSRLPWMSSWPGGKALRYFVTWILFVVAGLSCARPDVVLAYSPPLNLSFAAVVVARLRKLPLVLNMQDIHPKALVDLGFVRNAVLIRVLEAMERAIYRHAHHCIVYSRLNAEHLKRHGVPTNRITIIPNWVDTDVVTPGSGSKEFRDAQGLSPQEVVFSYAGTIGRAQGLDVVVRAAKELCGVRNLVVLMAGDGDSKAALEAAAAQAGVENLRFLPFLPQQDYLKMLAGSDVCLLCLNRDTPAETVPGKLPQLMAAGRPILAVVPAGGFVESTIRGADCGMSVAPGDPAGLKAAILTLHRDRGLRERMGISGRRYAEREYSRRACTARYLDVISGVLGEVR
jgi:colanic acid biosynthesis glycosyl transferase WcaI